MKEVFRHSSPAQVSLFKTVLENAGIACFIRNADTQQAIVASLITAIIPVPEFWPTLCVMHDEDYPAAMELLREAGEPDGPEWTCPKCGKPVPGNFAVCWNCGGEQG